MEKKILAKVGQKEISNLDVQSAIQGLDPYQAQQFQTEEGQKYVLDDLINQELLYMYAKDNKIDQDEQFRNEMKRVEEDREENVYKYSAKIKLITGGNFGYTFRVMPKHEMLLDSENMNLVKWMTK